MSTAVRRAPGWVVVAAGAAVLAAGAAGWAAAAPPAPAPPTPPGPAARVRPPGPVLGVADPACRAASPDLRGGERVRRPVPGPVPRWCHPALN